MPSLTAFFINHSKLETQSFDDVFDCFTIRNLSFKFGVLFYAKVVLNFSFIGQKCFISYFSNPQKSFFIL